ncbi:MAG: hypothetical protein Q9219_002927 [cf. Caloplaca sp. 3 TL-2023]
MSSLTTFFKRPRSKSEKGKTPPKIIFGDLSSAYASIAQKSNPSSPNLPLQPPRLEVSPSASFLRQQSPEIVPASHLPGDLLLSKDYGASLSKTESDEASALPDPFSSGNEHRRAVQTLELEKNVLNGYFGVKDDDNIRPLSKSDEFASSGEGKTLSACQYLELEKGQLEACSKLSGITKIEMDGTQPLNRTGTIRSLSKRHSYGQVASNDEIRSHRGSRVEADFAGRHESNVGRAVRMRSVEEVEWSPRSSLEAYMTQPANVHGPAGISPPAAVPLTHIPRGKHIPRYGRLPNFSSSKQQVSRFSQSYGDTEQLLEHPLPRFPRVQSQGDGFYKVLVDFAKELPSSSSHGNSSKSFATFSIEDTNGNPITRPVSQGEFQQLENVISSHLRRESQASNVAASHSFVHVGQISFEFSEASEADPGPGSSQTTASSEVESNIDYSVIQPALRTRNGTPPLLYGESNATKKDADWETVAESNCPTSSFADHSDTASRSPEMGSLFMNPGKIIKHPAHPRYNHSWSLQQDTRSGAYVLTPQYKQSRGSSFPNFNGVVVPEERTAATEYSHPAPLLNRHAHPFTCPPPALLRVPSIPTKNPSRSLKRSVPAESIELLPIKGAAYTTQSTSQAADKTASETMTTPAPGDLLAVAPRSTQRKCRVGGAPRYKRPCLDVGPDVEALNTKKRRIARYYLAACGVMPVLLLPFILGWLDVIIRIHTSGQYRAFPVRDKRTATMVLIAWVVVFVCVAPAMAIVFTGY